VCDCIIIDPVLFRVTHPAAAGNLARQPRSRERAGTRAIAECLSPAAALARAPLIDDHLDRHMASPHAGPALFLLGSRRKSAVTAFAVDRKRRCNTPPRWQRDLLGNLTHSGLQIADLAALDGFQTRVGNPRRINGHSVTNPELVFGVSAFTQADKKFSRLTPNAE